MFALVDCNNFYASCERIFNLALRTRPVAVLSNNDGCIIARSEETEGVIFKSSVSGYSRLTELQVLQIDEPGTPLQMQSLSVYIRWRSSEKRSIDEEEQSILIRVDVSHRG